MSSKEELHLIVLNGFYAASATTLLENTIYSPRISTRIVSFAAKCDQPLSDFAAHYPRDEAMARAYLSGQHTMAEIARQFDVHYATVSRAVKRFERME